VTPDDAITFARLASTAAFGGTASPEAGPEARALEERLITQLRDSVGRRDRVLAPIGHAVRRVRDRAASVRERAREKSRV
jgi:predicted nuclease with TOPRIM domain